MKKRFFAAFLAACLVCVTGVSTVHAQDYNENDDSAQTAISASIQNSSQDPDPGPDPEPPENTSSWVVSIPATLSLSSDGFTPFGVSASKMDLYNDRVLRVKIDTARTGMTPDGTLALNNTSGGSDQAIFYFYRSDERCDVETMQTIAMFYDGDTTEQLLRAKMGLFPDIEHNAQIASGTYSGNIYFNIALSDR